ncbi:M28 family peptidase [Paenibacillus sp. N3/727]|uniref:M28 family peptidase n=1 Tax=Paenibacillus sp. N3/727 TaxID=2925845 RepID=UPI001F53DBF6|nr:M28 family peptidase [Paenibacillus sp. N3/727]UNK15880.1 M28 family peptidase [Paenibacillus sp. N3/727]
MRKQWKIILFTSILILITIAVSFTQFSNPNESSHFNDEKFSVERAMQHLEVIAKEPHPVGSEANKKVKDYIVKYFESLNLPVEIQTKAIEDVRDKEEQLTTDAEYLENIIVKIEGTSLDHNAVLFLAHYDSTPETPGASDDGYGVVTLMETARMMSQLPPPENTLYFVFTDGEEEGVLGATALKDRKDIFDKTRMIINFEARGNTGVPILFETTNHNAQLVKEFSHTVSHPVAYSFASEMYKKMPNYTDFTEVKDIPKLGYNIANMGGVETYHANKDTFENSDRNTIRHFGAYAIPLAEKYAMLSTTEFEELEKNQGDAIYFPLMKNVLVVYSDEVVIPLMTLLIGLTTIAAIILIRKKIIKVKTSALTFVSMLASFIGVAAILYGLVKILAIVFDGVIDDEGLIVLGNYDYAAFLLIMLITIVLSAFISRWISKHISAIHFIISIQLIWITLAITTSLTFKGISYLFVLPALLGVFLIIVALEKPQVMLSNYRYIVIASWTIVTTILLAPFIYVIYTAQTLKFAPILGILVALLIMPIIAAIQYKSTQT